MESNEKVNEHSELLKLFKSHRHKLECYHHVIIINPDRIPASQTREPIRRFNAPVVDDVAGIMVGDRTARQQIVIPRIKNNL